MLEYPIYLIHIKFYDLTCFSLAQCDSPLIMSSSDMRRLSKYCKPGHNLHETMVTDNGHTVAVATKSEPTLHRQSSMISHLGSSMRRKMSTAGQVIAREEGRTAKVSYYNF